MIKRRRRGRGPSAKGEYLVLDEIDEKIIGLLREDGRRPNVAIAQIAGVSEGTVRKRLQRLIKNGYLNVIAVTDPLKLGLAIDVTILMHVEAGKALNVSQQLSDLDEVRYVGITTGTYDIMAVANFRSSQELFDFLNFKVGSIQGITKTETMHVLRVVKRTYDRTMTRP